MTSNNAAIELVCETANSLFPELKMRTNELSHPTEAFLTKVLIHYLRSFGFRMEAPYVIDSDAKDTSREKRLFLAKLCRQVERILQISFPGKTFTYIDIIEPTARKTSSTLDVLFNYRCFYKMHKKEVISPIVERHMERQALHATIAAKQNELDQAKQRAAQMKIDISKSEANICKLREKLPQAQAQLQEHSKALRQKQAEVAQQEEQLSELNNQVNTFKQLVVQDSDVANLKTHTEQIVANIEGCKLEKAKQEDLFKERRQEIEANLLLGDEIEKAMKILSPEVLGSYKDKLRLAERMEKKHASLESKHQALLAANEKQKQQFEQCEQELKALKLQCEQDAQVPKQKIADQEALIEQQTSAVEELEQRRNSVLVQIDEEVLTAEHTRIFVTKLFGEHAQ